MRSLSTSIAMLLLAQLLAPPAWAQLYITELMAVNDTTIADDDGDFSDWLEIFNAGTDPVDLTGWYLTDDDAELTKWEFPSVTLGAGEYLLVWTSDKDRRDPGAALHTNFKLTSDGEYLALVRADASTIEHEYAPAFPPQAPELSYGLSLDLAAERCFGNPTPGAANDESLGCDPLEPVTFSVERGFHDAPFSLELSTPTTGATIHYTLDGSDPSQTHGTAYTAPIDVSTTSMVRAMSFKPGVGATGSITHTYIFLADVIRQSADDVGPEYKESWPVDIDMDPDVVDDPRYAATIKEDLRSIPTMSIVTDVDHLFGPADGIYSHPMGRGEQWERPTSMELIRPAGGNGFQINCGIRMHGGSSRFPPVKKHSMRLLFKSIYGASKMEFPLYAESPVDSFDTLVLNARSGKSWHRGSGKAQYLRRTWAKDTMRDMGQLSPHVAYVHLYLNGLYWGLYRVVERPDAKFLAAHLGGEPEDYDALKSDQVLEGDKDAWNTMQALADAGLDHPANYASLLDYVDVDNLIDYFMMNGYGGNWDWDHHNWYAGRRRVPGAGFLFFAWDAEHVVDSLTQNALSNNNESAPSSVYNNLRKESAEFRIRYADRVHRHLFNGGALTPAAAAARWMKRAAEIDRAVVGESARWGDKARTVAFTRDLEWLVEQQRLLLAYFPRRTAVMIDQFRSKGLYPEIDAPTFNQHGGRVSADFQLEISAPQGIVYYTDDGQDPRLPGGAVAPGARAYTAPLTLAASVEIKARARAGLEWSALDEAVFVLDIPVRITELSYNPPGGSGLEFVELTNVGDTAQDLSGVAFTDGIDFTFGSALIAPGAHVLVVSDQAAFEGHYGAGLPVAGSYTGKLDNAGEHLRLEAADGGAIHDFAYDDAWYPATDGGGRTLVVRDAGADPDAWGQAATWRPSTFADGSPGAAELAACSDGVDNDGDGATDYPADAGCADGAQDDEAPACDDGVDNDGDGAVDAADPQCEEAAAVSEAPPPVDAFMSYRAKGNRDVERFERFEVTLSDAFESDVVFEVRKQKAIAFPAGLNDGPVVDAATRLEAYQIREASGQPKHVPREELELVNAFGLSFVDTRKPRKILIPSAADFAVPPPPPDEAAHVVDRYKCYRAKVTRGTPKYFPSGAQAAVASELESKGFRLKKPKHFCTPVSVDGSEIKNPDGYLLCYPAKVAKNEAKHARVEAIHVANEFGAELLDTVKEEELCLPTKKVSGTFF